MGECYSVVSLIVSLFRTVTCVCVYVLQRVPGKDYRLPMFEKRLREFDELAAKMSLEGRTGRVTLGAAAGGAGAPTAAAGPGAALVVYGLDAAAVSSAVGNARTFIDNQYMSTGNIITGASDRPTFDIVAESVRDTVALHMPYAEVTADVVAFTVAVRVLGNDALVRAELLAQRAINTTLRTATGILPPEHWDSALPSRDVRRRAVPRWPPPL